MFLLANTAVAFFVLFFERKRATSIWAWVLLLFFLPVVGLLLYLLFGLPHRQNKGKHPSVYSNPNLQKLWQQQLRQIDRGWWPDTLGTVKDFRQIIRMNLKTGEAPLSTNNGIAIFIDGKNKFDSLFKDIEAAKDHIHLEYYILRNDKIGCQLIERLTEKAKQGVKVLILYDDIGSKSLPKNFFADFFQAGGKAAASLPSRIPIGNPRVNYRNHRKIAVIDGKVGYIGGFNVGDEYLGEKGKFGYWRDTHLRIEGTAVHSLQNRFLIDWNSASDKYSVKYADKLFPSGENSEGAAMQVVGSGPNENIDQIKNGFLKLIVQAKESVYLQTPYFIPDQSILDALCTASLSGVDVRIMIPNKADHLFVHTATLSFVEVLLEAEVKVYKYDNGFLHAKTLVVDRKAFSVGSANMDIRSFSLNYEANIFAFEEKAAEEMAGIFLQDIKLSKELTMDAFEDRSLFEYAKQRIAKLVAPIL
ncbi:cardiolipin synthase [Planomicrobium sp. CPCC 101079]|uniref:cardiolipin synthase n=1 Tax=Planomicrobium sp. CPCC 101079 TaxID=2599618 RepID=UPI0011B54070|nr:cardiolipin synthase [Planomicrobium sp. CPCC 101079]TWT13129.1 cardiolipin synthase [Planomicrobium sp. CPCC 101079]